MAERETAVAKAATVENTSGLEPAAMKHRAAAAKSTSMNGRAMESATAVVTAAAVVTSSTSAMATTTMATATNFSGQSAGGHFCRGRRARIDQ